ncbi:MAG: GNAT family N-acetyltransferase, partial [Bryobacteraceae bacterium]
VGGQAFGAFDGERMIAFCLAIPGLKPGGRSYLHSHMLGVLPEYRNRGVGRLLKLEQRTDAIARGIELIEWTFDPLELKNAYFNIERLGAIVRRYVPNQYGTTSSHLHGGLPTDRCVAEWWISTGRVNRILAGQPYQRPTAETRISVPATIGKLRRSDPKAVRRIQTEVSEQFLEHFRAGLAVVGFERPEGAGTYLLGTWDSK